MKSADEWCDEMDNASGSLFDRTTSLLTIRKAQLDAYKQALNDACKLLHDTYGKRAASPRMCEETIKNKLVSQSRE